MCRDSKHGGRRCPSCSSASVRARHNERRRENRATKARVTEAAAAMGEPPEVVAMLHDAPPSVAKAWGVAHGIVPATGASTGQHGWPASPDQIDRLRAAMATQGRSSEEWSLMSDEITDVEAVEDPGVNETFRVWLISGGKAYFKPISGLDPDYCQAFGQPDVTDSALAEVAAYRLAVAMGPPWDEMVPPVVLREVGIDRETHDPAGGAASVETVMELGTLMGDAGGIPAEDWMDYFGGSFADDQMRVRAHRVAVFDALLGNQDRHLHNCMVDEDDGTIRLIDHGFSCIAPGHGGRRGVSQSVFVANFAGYMPDSSSEGWLTDEEKAAVGRVTGSEDLCGLTAILPPARADAVRRRGEAMLATGRILSQIQVGLT